MKTASRRLGTAVALAAVASIVVSLLGLPSEVVQAHANLAQADPAPNSVLVEPPGRVTIWFTEPIELGFSDIRVLDAEGRQVDNGDSHGDPNDPAALSVTLGPLSNGTYTVAWKNVSTVDGHLVRGSFVFSVGEPISGGVQAVGTEQPLLQSPVEPVLRWLVSMSILAALGGLAFELLITRPVLVGGGASQAMRGLGERLASRMLKLIWMAMALFLGASVVQLLVQTAVIHDISLHETFGSPLSSVLTDTDWGDLWLWRVGLLAGMAAVLAMLRTVPPKDQQNEKVVEFLHRVFRALALGIGAGVLLTLSLVSHGAATGEVESAAVFSDYLHLLAAALWVGGLFHFAAGLPLIARTLSQQERRSVLAALVPRFSALATLSVGTLVITGLYGAWAQVTIVEALITPYGLTLVAKLGLVSPLLVLGAINLLWVRRRLVRKERAGLWLRRFVTGEAVMAVLVLVAVGMLVSLEPARQVASREGIGQDESLAFRDSAEGAAIAVAVEPGQVGPNRFMVDLKDRRGDPIVNASDVSLRLTYLDADLGEETVSAASAGNGTYVLEDGLLSIAGPWQVELVIRRPDAFDARTAFRFEVSAAGAAGNGTIKPSSDTGKLLWGAELALLGALFIGTGLPLGGWFTRAGAGVMMPGIVAFMAGVVLMVNTQFGQSEDEILMRNPFPPNPESLAIGRELYALNCQSCHGVEGRGDGPAAAGLEPPPSDLVVHVPLHPERDLFRFVRDGISGTAMAPLGDSLAGEEIWHVINYVKTFEE